MVENGSPSLRRFCRTSPRFLALILAAGSLVLVAKAGLAATVIYQTGFEASEGYTTNLDLAGQKGWLQDGSGGNGLLSGFFSTKGQQAYVGFDPPANKGAWLYLYQPLNRALGHVQFSVTMALADSSNTNWDDFYWSVYNRQVQNLVTLDFDNYFQEVYYWLDGASNRVSSGLKFTNGVAYPLKMDLDFANNHWSATFDGKLVATNQPLTTTKATLDLGDIDAAWMVYDTNYPGNNYMVFDDYLVTTTLAPPSLQLLGIVGGAPALRLSGEPNNDFAIESSTNLSIWSSLKTNTTTGGYFDFIDVSATNLRARYYRGRWVP